MRKVTSVSKGTEDNKKLAMLQNSITVIEDILRVKRRRCGNAACKFKNLYVECQSGNLENDLVAPYLDYFM